MSAPVELGPWWGGGVESGSYTLSEDSAVGDTVLVVGGDGEGTGGFLNRVVDSASNVWTDRASALHVDGGGDIFAWDSTLRNPLPSSGYIEWVGDTTWPSINSVAINVGQVTYESAGSIVGSSGAAVTPTATCPDGGERLIVAAVAHGGDIAFSDSGLHDVYNFSDGTQTLRVAYRDYMPEGAYETTVTPGGAVVAVALVFSAPPPPPEPNWLARARGYK